MGAPTSGCEFAAKAAARLMSLQRRLLRVWPGTPSATVLLGTVACATSSPSLTAAHRAAIVDSVQVMLTSWRDAVNAKNMTRAAAFYSSDPDFRWFEDGELKYRSAKEIGDTMKAMAPAIRSFAISLIEPQITALAPGVAVVTTTFAQKLTDTTGQTIGFVGAVSMTVVHGDSGWKFLVGHTSSVAPPPDTARKGKGRRT